MTLAELEASDISDAEPEEETATEVAIKQSFGASLSHELGIDKSTSADSTDEDLECCFTNTFSTRLNVYNAIGVVSPSHRDLKLLLNLPFFKSDLEDPEEVSKLTLEQADKAYSINFKLFNVSKHMWI